MSEYTVASLAGLVQGQLIGDGSVRIVGVCDLRQGQPDRIGFVRDAKYRDAARGSAAGALITPCDLDTAVPQIVVADVALAYARVAGALHPSPRATSHQVHPSAVVDPAARLQEPVAVAPRVVIGSATIGAGTVLMAGAVVGDGVVIGRDCVIHPNVTLCHGVVLGDRVTVHCGAVIGSDGFGYAKEGEVWRKVPQIGSVRLHDDVEIGANTTIDRGAMGDTVIGAGTKIDNLCHLGHNVRIGRNAAVAAAAFVAGSTTLGDRVILGGHVAISGHLKLADDVRIGGASVLFHSVPEGGDYMGYPLMEKRLWLRHHRDLRRRLEASGDAGAGDA